MANREALASEFARIRARSLALAEGLSAEDCQLQSMPDASPVKWHLAHVTWFFETFVLGSDPRYRAVDPAYRVLFNSYYVGIGERAPRAERGLMSRPSLDEVLRYRQLVDARIAEALHAGRLAEALLDVLVLGLHHEQQHQELIVTDLKHHLSRNPLRPIYRPAPAQPEAALDAGLRWRSFEAGVAEIGHEGDGFSFDNETPRHRVFVEAFALASRLVSNGEYEAFIADGGYRRPELWLSDGWDQVQAQGWQAPLYWSDPWMNEGLGDGHHYTLAGLQPRDAAAPVCHVSYYEADAYARWAGVRLPTEAEWEVAAQRLVAAGPLIERRPMDDRHFAPQPAVDGVEGQVAQLLGDCWQWTQSAYLPYPGFQPATGAVGEYNGKFMINQMVLRGSSCATPAGHSRTSYRNFFPPAARWQFSGIRLARSA